MTKQQMNCDLLVVSPHTDDAEIGLGGTIAALAGRGQKVWALDLTRGELGTNATVDQRWREAAEASGILGLHGRLQLALPDGFINPTDAVQLAAVVWALRTFRPRFVVTAPDPVRHPDHLATPALVQRAVFMSRLVQFKVKAPQFLRWEGGAEIPATAEQWIISTLFSVCPVGEKPSLLFDISDHWHLKEKALAVYASQFKRETGRRATHINGDGFLEKIERRAQSWGDQAGRKKAEAFITMSVPVVDDFCVSLGWSS